MMNPKIKVMAIAGVLFTTACGSADKLAQQEFCDRMAPAICEKLFDQSCPHAEPRYESEQRCRQAEGDRCQSLIDDAQLGFDQTKAAECIAQIEKATCQEAVRSDFHDCNGVFSNLDPPIEEIDE